MIRLQSHEASPSARRPLPLVLDTNIVLDLFVFDDVHAFALKDALLAGTVQWLATCPMRHELERVLAYPHIAARLALRQRSAADVLASFDCHACMLEVAQRAQVTCSDPDDQMFIDLAVHQQCALLTKDAAVLALKRQLALLQVDASAVPPATLS